MGEPLDLIPVFDALAQKRLRQGQSDLFLARELTTSQSVLLAIDSHGEPAILVLEAASVGVRPPVRLAHITIQRNLLCRVLSDQTGTAIEAHFACARLVDSSASMKEHMLWVVAALSRRLLADPTPSVLETFFDDLTEIFGSAATASLSDVVGLWGELFLIHQSPNPIPLIEAWHTEDDEDFDFRTESGAIEVKCSRSRRRAHFFSHSQLVAPGNAVLVSILVDFDPEGFSISGLLRSIDAMLLEEHKALSRLHRRVARVLGVDPYRFDHYMLAPIPELGGLTLFSMSTIPKLNCKVPTSISKIRYEVDLDGIIPIAQPDHF